MANALTTTAPWTPPESKSMQSVVKYGGIFAIAGIGIYAFTRFAPTMVDAVTLLDTILQDVTHMAISGAVLVGTLWLLHELFSSTGSINHLVKLPYWALVNGLTRYFITIDPLSPITTRINQVRTDQAVFEKQFETLDGIISNLHDKSQRYRADSLKAQRLGVAAASKGLSAAQDVAAHKFGSAKDAADFYDTAAAKLTPARETFQKISQSSDILAQKLEYDRDLLRDKWETQKVINTAVDAAGRILGQSKTQIWADAQQAESIINDKYGEELGHLDHLKRFAEPFMQSIDVENASYNEEMLSQVQAGGQKLITSVGGQATLPTSGVIPFPVSVGNDPNMALASLIR